MFSWNLVLWLRIRFVATGDAMRLRAVVQRKACRRLCRILNISVHSVPENAPAGAYLIASNHLGVLDALVLASVFDVAFVGKSDIVGWPGVGWVTRTVGMIPVHRERRMATSDFVTRVRERLAAGVSVLVFPEGTTSSGDRVCAFKTGSFEAIVGLDNQCVLPVSVAYSSIDVDQSKRMTSERPYTWSDPQIAMLDHCWQVVGHRGAIAEIRIGREILVGERRRRDLAVESQNAVAELRAMSWPDLSETALSASRNSS